MQIPLFKLKREINKYYKKTKYNENYNSLVCFFNTLDADITKTSPCIEDPLTPHFYIVKLGFTGVYIFSYSCSKI